MPPENPLQAYILAAQLAAGAGMRGQQALARIGQKLRDQLAGAQRASAPASRQLADTQRELAEWGRRIRDKYGVQQTAAPVSRTASQAPDVGMLTRAELEALTAGADKLTKPPSSLVVRGTDALAKRPPPGALVPRGPGEMVVRGQPGSLVPRGPGEMVARGSGEMVARGSGDMVPGDSSYIRTLTRGSTGAPLPWEMLGIPLGYGASRLMGEEETDASALPESTDMSAMPEPTDTSALPSPGYGLPDDMPTNAMPEGLQDISQVLTGAPTGGPFGDSSRTMQQSMEGPESAAASVKVQRGDTLWTIAERELGDGAAWPAIWEANAKRLGITDPNQISPGMDLQIPLSHGMGADRQMQGRQIADAAMDGGMNPDLVRLREMLLGGQ